MAFLQTSDQKVDPSNGGKLARIVTFYQGTVEDPSASEKAGRPIHRTIDRVKLTFPNNKSLVIDKPCDGTNPLAVEFAEVWAQYKKLKEDPTDGTPLKACPRFSAGDVASLKAIGLVTVEALGQYLGEDEELLRLKSIAEGYLGASDEGALVEAKERILSLEKALADREAEVELLKEELAKAKDQAGKKK